MRLAIQKALLGISAGQTPFGACIVRKNQLIAAAHNVVWKTTDITAHAEIHTLRIACKKLKKIDLANCIIYSTCEPCPMCFSAIHWAGISRIIYGTSIRDAQALGFRELTIPNIKMKFLGKSSVMVLGGFMRKENMDLFRRWARTDRRKTY